MAQQTNQEILHGLDKLITEAQARLAANADFIALKALEKARAEIVGVTAKVQESIIQNVMTELLDKPYQKRVSHLDGAATTLEQAGHPLPIRELMEGAISAGAAIGGDNPQVNFGSSLSKSSRFKSVKWKGDYAWWFSDRPIPTGVTRIRLFDHAEKEAAE